MKFKIVMETYRKYDGIYECIDTFKTNSTYSGYDLEMAVSLFYEGVVRYCKSLPQSPVVKKRGNSVIMGNMTYLFRREAI